MADQEYTRRETLRGAGALGGGLTLGRPLLIGTGSDVLTELATSRPDERIEHGTAAIPSWHVTFDPESKDSLQDWLGADDDRAIVREHDSLNAMTVKAPAAHVGADLWGRATGAGLQTKGYIERIDRNISMSIPEPIRNLSDDSVWEHDIGLLESVRMGTHSSPSPDGVAFDEDAQEATIADAKAHTRADQVTADTSGLTVAIIDTGADADSIFEDDTGTTRILDASTNFITDEAVGTSGLDVVADDNGHGNWVGSCIAANTDNADYEGFLPGASLLILKALDEDGQGSTERITAAVETAIAEDVDLLCMSLGSPLYSAQLADAITEAADQGIVPVVAAGNDRFGTTWTASPSDAPDAISVHATNVPEDPIDRDATQSAYFANVGPDPGTGDLSGGETTDSHPDVAAPGMKLTALTPDSERTLSGTSMAAPVVVGCLGLLLASDPGLSVGDVHGRIVYHSYRVGKVAQAEAASGLIDAKAMVDQIEREETQNEALTNEAKARDASYRAYSTAQGSRFARLF